MKQSVVRDVGSSIKAGQPNLTIHIDDDSLKSWNRQIYTMIEAAGEGAEELVDNMSRAVLTQSQKYVPKDTFTLYNSAYSRVDKKQAIYVSPKLGSSKGYTFYQGVVGYGDNEQAGGPNPRSGQLASSYAWKVHEDMSMRHPNGGQAKFLERAYREYVASELGPEMVHLERCIYLSKRYTPVFKYGVNFRQFEGRWERKRRNERTRDSITNLDRLSKIYENAKGGK